MLELQSISLKVGERTIVKPISFALAPGQTMSIMGASGSGKSSLLRIIAGLNRPSSGKVSWMGEDITRFAPERRHFALMFQDFALFPHLTIIDNVAFGLVEQGQRRSLARQQAAAMLETFGLSKRGLENIHHLSGGEQQRVALARALITSPRVLLLDEPFSALDASLRLHLREEFRERIAAAKMATVLVTHDEEEAKAMASGPVMHLT